MQDKGFDSSCAACTNKFYGIKFDNTAPSYSSTASGTQYSYNRTSAKNSSNQSITSEVIKINIDSIWNLYQAKLATNPTYKLGEAVCFSLIDVINASGHNAGSNLTSHYTTYAYEEGTAKFHIIYNQGNSPGMSTFSKINRNDNGGFDEYEHKETINRLVVHTILDAEDTNIQAGSESERHNKLYIKLPTMSKDSIMINKVCALTEDLATNSIDYLDFALREVSSHRSRMGAYQNRLEHADKNLNNVVENTTAAESQIRDTDMAKEMVKYSNNNILQQAGQAMLSQSSKSNQGILSLING